eukprot:3760627-Pyramimonas_sp.AAC.1
MVLALDAAGGLAWLPLPASPTGQRRLTQSARQPATRSGAPAMSTGAAAPRRPWPPSGAASAA